MLFNVAEVLKLLNLSWIEHDVGRENNICIRKYELLVIKPIGWPRRSKNNIKICRREIVMRLWTGILRDC